MPQAIFRIETDTLPLIGLLTTGSDEPTRYFSVNDAQLRDASSNGLNGIRAILTADREVPHTAEYDAAPRLRPFHAAPSADGLVGGFMRSHVSKMPERTSPREPVEPARWFFKGIDRWLRESGDALHVPADAIALIEEPEVVLVFLSDEQGDPKYAGYTLGNDLCDIGLHLKDPAYNPYCKLCETSLLPYVFLDTPPTSVTGTVTITRNGQTSWKGDFSCGTDSLYYTADEMVGHFFSYPIVRRPGALNYVFLGADSASYHDGYRIADGDDISIDFASHNVQLNNHIAFTPASVVTAS